MLFGSSGATFDVQVGASSSGTNTITLTTEALNATGSATGGLGLTSGRLRNDRDAFDEVLRHLGELGACWREVAWRTPAARSDTPVLATAATAAAR